MCYVLVSNGWRTAGVAAISVRALVPVNGTARVWDMGHWSIQPPLFEVFVIAKTRPICLRLPQVPVQEMFIVIIKANTILDCY